MKRFREVDVLAVLVAVCCSLLAWSARYAVNPDGVSYLDLGVALRQGDVQSLVQGYWSPLYPILIAIGSALTGATGMVLLPVVHGINALTAVAIVAIIWHWARKYPDPFFGRAALAAFLVSSARPPRVEAITPDLLLLCFAAALAYQLLHNQGRRWIVVGLLLGLMFLSKTSTWPWLLVAIGVRWWGARTPEQRTSVIRSSLVALAVMLCWVVPVSSKAKHFTLGSAGRLNYCWYLASCDSQTPDNHTGLHRNYQTFRLGDAREFGVARFEERSPWTYQPWGDPTAWETGVTESARATPSLAALVKYWGTLAWNVVGLWMAHLLVLVLLPVVLVARRPGKWRELRGESRDSAVVMLLGIVGIAQFIAIHAEPRLIAPFVMMFALGVLAWCLSPSPTVAVKKGKVQPEPEKTMWHVCTWLGLISTGVVMVARLSEGFEADQRIASGISMMQQAKGSINPDGARNERLAVIGPAMPMVANAYLLDWHIVAQVRPGSVEKIVTLPPEQLQATLNQLFGGIADAAWVALPDNQFQFVRIAPK